MYSNGRVIMDAHGILIPVPRQLGMANCKYYNGRIPMDAHGTSKYVIVQL